MSCDYHGKCRMSGNLVMASQLVAALDAVGSKQILR